jgi:hypothetical protein
VVELEVADELAVDEDVGVPAVGEDEGVLVLPLDSDVDVEPAGDDLALGGDGGVVAAGGEVGMSDRSVGGTGGGKCSPAADRGPAADALVGAVVVVDLDELIELGLEGGQVGGEGSASEPALEGLLEPFDLPGGLGVVRGAGGGLDACVAEVGLEADLEASELPGEREPVVGQDTGGLPGRTRPKRRRWSLRAPPGTSPPPVSGRRGC